MMKLHPKYLSGLAAVGIYVGIIGLIFFYFGYRSETKNTHFVAKNANAITVTLQAPKRTKNPKKKSTKSPSKPKPKKIKHAKPKPLVSRKPAKVKPTKPAKKKPITKKPVKKIQAKSLFSNIKSRPNSRPNKTKTAHKPKAAKKSGQTSKPLRNALTKQPMQDKGVENRYLASVQERLYGWPAQSNFAGAVFTIGLTIHPNGRFEYVVLRPSDNPEFNRTIEQYLKQLREIGFDPTPRGKKYEFKVEIVAK